MTQAHPQAAPLAAPRLLPLGLDSYLVRFATVFSEPANRAARAFGLAAQELDGVTEVLPALAATQVRFDPARSSREAVAAALNALIDSRDWGALPPEPVTRRWHLPISFDAADAPGLARAAASIGATEAEAVADILAAEPRVLAIGFAPGQPYMGLLPERWDFPRQTDLAREVPAGALTVAIRQLVLFANASPTGWLQIARAGLRPYQPGAADPMPLRSGDAFRFHRVGGSELATLERNDPMMGGARLEVLDGASAC